MANTSNKVDTKVDTKKTESKTEITDPRVADQEVEKIEDVNKNTALATLPEDGEWGEFADKGYEETTANDYSRTFVSILQALSPAVRERRMFEGDILITGYDISISGKEGLEFIPVYSHERYVAWTPRDRGGGFAGVYMPNDPLVLKQRAEGRFNNMTTPAGDDLVQTFYLFVIGNLNGIWRPMIISLSSTKIKPYSSFRSRLDLLRLPSGKRYPLFAHRCRLTTVMERKNNNDFYNVSFSLAGDSLLEARVDMKSEAFKEAIDLHKTCAAGLVEIDHTAEPGRDEISSGGGSPSLGNEPPVDAYEKDSQF